MFNRDREKNPQKFKYVLNMSYWWNLVVIDNKMEAWFGRESGTILRGSTRGMPPVRGLAPK